MSVNNLFEYCSNKYKQEHNIAEEKLVVSDEELETELQTIADYYKKELAEVKKIFEGNMSRIENDLLTRKAIELVKDNLKK